MLSQGLHMHLGLEGLKGALCACRFKFQYNTPAASHKLKHQPATKLG